MEPRQFVRKPQPVVAVQFDGTTAGAYALLGWLLGLRGTSGYFQSGVKNQGPDGPVVAAAPNDENRSVLKDEWVVVAVGGVTRVLTPGEFADEYEVAPQVKPQPLPHLGHKPGCRCARTRSESPIGGPYPEQSESGHPHEPGCVCARMGDGTLVFSGPCRGTDRMAVFNDRDIAQQRDGVGVAGQDQR